MAKLRYRQVMRIADLVDDKILSLEKDKSSEANRKSNFTYNIKEEDTDVEKKEQEATNSRFDKIISEYQEIKTILEAELEHLEFEFGIKERNQWTNKDPKPQQNP